ncbi:MAG: class I SAM-dependent methyltransferase [Phycisphaerae bacterium]|nr:class I SAM-dependent methyltransferase [Phycisphaerae bacterium]
MPLDPPTSDYLASLLAPPDDALASYPARARAAGLPDIAVSPDVGRLLLLFARLATINRPGLAIELGTLGGYSASWIARGLPTSGRLISVEPNPRHADFALDHLRRAGLADRVSILRSTALDALPQLLRDLGPSSVDLLFVDAIKAEYPDYWRLGRPLLRPGGLFLADNALGSDWWITDPPGSSASRDALARLNADLASDPSVDTALIANRQGLLVARLKTPAETPP